MPNQVFFASAVQVIIKPPSDGLREPITDGEFELRREESPDED